MPVNSYEGMFILDSARFNREASAVTTEVNGLLEAQGAEIQVSRLWEERRLAYPIDGHRKGTYWLTYFRMDSSKVSELTRQCLLNENVLRVLFLKIDPRIADALVAHARGEKLPGEEDGDEDGEADNGAPAAAGEEVAVASDKAAEE